MPVVSSANISAPYFLGNFAGNISGNFTAADANELANMLSIGKLPATTEIIEESVVGPSLGAATINAGLFSLLGGFLLVLIFMLVYYSYSGVIAVATLFLNIFIIFVFLRR